MQQHEELRRDLVLVGGGHAHALTIRMLAMRKLPAELRITLVTPASHTPYSGMLPGLIAGHYRFEDTHIDLARLCQWAGVRFIQASVTGLDPHARQLKFADRPPLGYDIVSLDIGSQPEVGRVAGAADFAIPVKPVSSFLGRWEAFVAGLDGPTGPAHGSVTGGRTARHEVAVVGAGAGGVEIVLAMAHALRGRDIRWSLFTGRAGVLPGYSPAAQKAATQALEEHGVMVRAGLRVTKVSAQGLTLEDGTEHAAATIFWCTAASAAGWVADCGLETDRRGFLAVHDSLQSVSDPQVFAAGDIATQVNFPRPKAGVYAVRQAPVLAENLLRAVMATDKPPTLRSHQPQKNFLSLVSLGRQVAVAEKAWWRARGAWIWRWKDSIDSAFMRQFAELPPRNMRAAEQRSSQQQPCGGCGAKIGADPLQQALSMLRENYPQHLLPHGVAAEDAAVVPKVFEGAMLQSVDTLRAMVSDPFVMGQITAQHSLSDIYAAGAQPTSAQAHVVLPFCSARIQRDDLQQVLAGMLDVLQKADCVLIGGHSLQGPEMQLGLVVNAQMRNGHAPRRKEAVQVGDRLILTKPLGTGLLFAAHMQLQADGRDISAAIDQMRLGNAHASEVASGFEVRAATDVTGFGFLGHLVEMLPDGIGARLQAASIPLLPGVRQMADSGLRSTLWASNASTVQCRLRVATSVTAALGDEPTAILCDPQTSGGLLLAIAPDKAQLLVEALQSSGSVAANIGELVADADGQVVLE